MAERAVAGRTGAILPRGVKPFSLLAVSVGVAILLALGVWQVKRLAWKEALLARIAALQSAPPEPLDVVLHRLRGPGQVGGGEVDFVRVQADCPTVQQTPAIKLYTLVGGLIGDRVITACPIAAGPYRSLLVDRGVLPEGAALPPGGAVAQPLVGVLRKAERPAWLAPPNPPAGAPFKTEWRARDLPAMAAALHAPAPAPVFLMLERPAAPAPGPRPAAIPTDIPNNHLGYALTWFGLAAGLVGVYVANVIKARAG
jgi:surfeit locus 1 family protein